MPYAAHAPTLQLVTAETTVEVFAAGGWHPGHLRQWALLEQRGWVAWVRYTADGQPYVRAFTADRIRHAEPPAVPGPREPTRR